MSNASPIVKPRLLFFGMRCGFSAPPLAALIDAECDVRAVVLPAPPGAPEVRRRPAPSGNVVPLPLAGARPHVDEIADRAGIPVVEIANLRAPSVHTALAELRPEAIAVACFPWRIPRSVRELPRLGCLNLHPSLLPRWRGPEPLFWTFKEGDREAGATVHHMDQGFDTGPLLAQERVAVPPGVDGLAFERELAERGGRLLAATVTALAAGEVVPIAQDASQATYAAMPSDADLVIGSDQPAERIVDLVRGIVPLWGPLTLRIAETGAEFAVNGVIAVEPAGTLPAPVVRDGRTVRVRCLPGVVQLTVASPLHGHAVDTPSSDMR